MAILDINLQPSQKDLRWFGLIILALFGAIGAVVLWRSTSLTAAIGLWSVGVVLCFVYYAVRPFRKPIFVGWMRLVYPIGWTLSHVILGATYYLVLTPIGLLTRLFHQDEVQQGFDPQAKSYWVEHNPGTSTERYLRQF